MPDAVKTRTLGEETHRVFRARVVNPRWIAAMQRHGYKGAFELAATVDYLFGYDATAGVVDDWMYEKLAREYVFDETNRGRSWRSRNPWALRGITERLLEAADRGLWAEPDADDAGAAPGDLPRARGRPRGLNLRRAQSVSRARVQRSSHPVEIECVRLPVVLCRSSVSQLSRRSSAPSSSRSRGATPRVPTGW